MVTFVYKSSPFLLKLSCLLRQTNSVFKHSYLGSSDRGWVLHNYNKFLMITSTNMYSRTPLFRSPKGNEKKFEIAGLRNNRGSIKGKGKSKGIRSSFEIAGTLN